MTIRSLRAGNAARYGTICVALSAILGLLPQALAEESTGAAKAGAAAATGEPAVVLKATMAELEALRGKLDGFSGEFSNASPERKEEIRAEAAILQARGQSLIGKMIDRFPLAYAKDAENETVKEALPHMVFVYFQANRYVDAITYGNLLIKTAEPPPGVAQVTGMSYFANHDFDTALVYLQEAAKKGEMDRAGQATLAAAQTYGELWKKEMEIRATEKAADDLPRVVFNTNRGDIHLELFENEAPGAVGNFVSLVEKGFYKNTKFHRVIPNFMAQGGDPNTLDEDPKNDGHGGPGYTIPCECDRAEARVHFSGSLSMAHAGKNTGGSQFFLTHLPTDHLNGKHTVFGRIFEGLEVARSLQRGDTIADAKVVRKRDHPYTPPAAAAVPATEKAAE